MKRILTILLILICTGLLWGCGKEEHTFVLPLASNPESGFEWKVIQADELFEVEKEYKENESGDKKDDGTDTFTLHPVETGFTNVTFVYEKTDGSGQTGAQYSYSIIVDEELKIEVVSSTGELAGSRLHSSKIPVPVIR